MNDFSPYSTEELWSAFHRPKGSINKHLLLIYSLVVGLNASRVLELGIGSTTRTLRAAMKVTGGKVYSCDIDRERFSDLLEGNYDDWELHLCSSTEFLSVMKPPFEFAVHDGAHDYEQTRKDLEAIFPMMRQFGLVCIHDTQGETSGREMVAALKDAVKNYSVSYIHLPYNYGLTIVRIEKSDYKFVSPPWKKDGYAPETVCFPDSVDSFGIETRLKGWIKWKLRYMKRLLTGKYER